MQLFSYFPAVIAIPTMTVLILFQDSSFKYLNNLYQFSGTSENATEENQCNCSSKMNTAEQRAIMSKLIELEIPKENQVRVIEMLDTLDWIEVKKDASTWFTNIEKAIDIKTAFMLLVLFKLFSAVAFHMLMKHTRLGVCLEIACYHLKNYVFSSLTALIRKYSKTSSYNYSSDSDEEDDEMFMECSSIDLKDMKRNQIDGEELLAKSNEQEEKDLIPTSNGETDHNLSYESFMQSLQDDATSLNSTLHNDVTKEVPPVPEKLREYLHKKKDSIEKLGISFSEDGYLDADEDTFSGPESNSYPKDL